MRRLLCRRVQVGTLPVDRLLQYAFHLVEARLYKVLLLHRVVEVDEDRMRRQMRSAAQLIETSSSTELMATQTKNLADEIVSTTARKCFLVQ